MPARPWPALERTRLRLHFARVRLLLRAAPVPAGACPAARARSLAQLDAYARAGRFPLHGGRGRPRPVFVDAMGTHCAMGHLLAVNGHAERVRGIRAERNYAYIPELAGVPGVLPAIFALGLTTREAALIQPTYDNVDPHMGGDFDDGSGLILVVVFLMQALACSAVLLALGMLVSARVRTLFWTGGSARRVGTTLVLVVGGFFAYNMLP